MPTSQRVANSQGKKLMATNTTITSQDDNSPKLFLKVFCLNVRLNGEEKLVLFAIWIFYEIDHIKIINYIQFISKRYLYKYVIFHLNDELIQKI